MINSEKENKKAAADALRQEIAYSRHVYSRIVLFRYFVWYMLSFTTKACASDATQANTISPIIIIILIPFLLFINVVFSYLCSSLHLASCLATAYFMKFTLLLTSTASTTAKQQAATTNTIIIIVTLFLSNLIFSSPYWSSFFDCTAKVVPFVFAHKLKNNYFSFVITFIDIRQ